MGKNYQIHTRCLAYDTTPVDHVVSGTEDNLCFKPVLA